MPNSTRPIIAVEQPLKGNKTSWFFLRIALWLNDATAKRITIENIEDAADCDALILSGGKDLCPNLYSGQVKENYDYDMDRDALDMAIIKDFIAAKKPILGICRGAQALNVAHGGSLHFDVSKAYEAADYPTHLMAQIFFRKRTLIPDIKSIMRRIYDRDSVRVNSIHRQSIDRLATDFEITSSEKNGVVQAIEHKTHPFCLGVQYHPEYLIYSPLHRRLFKNFINSI